MARRRKLASLAIALFIEGLIVLLLLTLGANLAGEKDRKEKVVTFKAQSVAAAPAPEPEPESAPQETAPDTASKKQPAPLSPITPSPLVLRAEPAPPPAPPPPEPQASPSPPPRPKSTIGARVRPNAGGYGPADNGNPRFAGDSEMIGTAPNGEPLYAARWYREPTDQELAGYLSTANGPGYALIVCRTVSGYYVEDCALLSEGPQGAQIGRAVLAATWQFRVRPARIGGREQFGSWVRIRIDYTVRQRPR
jgi:protein TonB